MQRRVGAGDVTRKGFRRRRGRRDGDAKKMKGEKA
jgi:hypothetical protein